MFKLLVIAFMFVSSLTVNSSFGEPLTPDTDYDYGVEGGVSDI